MPIPRTLQPKLFDLAKHFPVVTVTGPRQSGKTTLCRMTWPDKPNVSLETPDVRAYAREDPRGFLRQHRDGAVLDEVQRVPELLSYLQAEVDADPSPGRFVLTGSANLLLLESVAQSLAGRTGLLTLLPLARDEVLRFPSPPDDLFDTLWTGGYPALFDRRIPPDTWLGAYVATYLERDVRQLLNVGDQLAFQRFLRLCAGRAGQLLNFSALAADAGVTNNTAHAWFSVLEASYIAFRLPPLHADLRKRLVKTPKLHFYDTGLLCNLLGITNPGQLRTHPLRGAIFETWVVSEVLKARLNRGLTASGVSFYRDRRGEEVDLVVDRGGALVAVEAKSGETFASDFFGPLARFRSGMDDGGHGKVVEALVVYGGDRAEDRQAGRALPWRAIQEMDWAGDQPSR